MFFSVLKHFKLALLFVASFFFAGNVLADESALDSSLDAPATKIEMKNESLDDLPPIDVREYDVTTMKHSKSKRIYLFEMSNLPPMDPSLSNEAQGAIVTPKIGKVILLRSSDKKPIMAFRSLKSYPEKKQFAAKRIKRYPGTDQIENDSNYHAIEKVANKEPPAPTLQDQKDLKELEDSELDGTGAGKSRSGDESLDDPNGSGKSGGKSDGELDEPIADPTALEEANALQDLADSGAEYDEDLGDLFSAEEIYPLDTMRFSVSIGFGLLANLGYTAVTSTSGSTSYTQFHGPGLRLGLDVAKRIFANKRSVQDFIHLEARAYNYSVVQYISQDSYSIYALSPILRYGFCLGQSMKLSFYGGALFNIAFETAEEANRVSQGKDALNSIFPAAGASIFFRLGPQWELQFDAGYDLIGGALGVRF